MHLRKSEHTTSLFCHMIARLYKLSQAALPTTFHRLLRMLDIAGKLLRVYTQNIDALEVKTGLSFGVPAFEERRKARPRQAQTTAPPATAAATPDETPRCIPLHGSVQKLHCQTCNQSYPLDEHISSMACGVPPWCPECTAMEATRELVGMRTRGVGKLRPSVVLYNESHRDGEGVGEVVRRDLVGTSSKGKGRRSGADLLLVVGTSLRVPGTKRIVREFAKAVRCGASPSPSKESAVPGLPAMSPSPGRSSASDEEPSFKSVYINLDFPVPTREWEGVFDVWVQGDAQVFAEGLAKEVENYLVSQEIASAKRRKREEEAALSKSEDALGGDATEPRSPQKKKAKPTTEDYVKTAQKPSTDTRGMPSGSTLDGGGGAPPPCDSDSDFELPPLPSPPGTPPKRYDIPKVIGAGLSAISLGNYDLPSSSDSEFRFPPPPSSRVKKSCAPKVLGSIPSPRKLAQVDDVAISREGALHARVVEVVLPQRKPKPAQKKPGPERKSSTKHPAETAKKPGRVAQSP
jgi:NAD-dependent SIR2 family protein deacetylase